MRKISLVTNIICAVLIISYITYLGILWKSIPQTVPTHFDMSGQPDAYGSKTMLLVLPVVMIILFPLMAVLENFPSLWNFPVRVTEENRPRLITIVSRMLAVEKVLAVLVLVMQGILMIVPGVPFWPMYVLIGLLLAVVVGGIAACRWAA